MIIGIGVDVVDHARLRSMIERLGLERLAQRLLTPDEQEYCLRMLDPVPHIGARVAAKEATFKALAGTVEARGIGWREIEVVHDEHRRPLVRLHGRGRQRAAELALSRVHLSLSHGDTSAIAFVVAESD
jgi:holo-[acyl-carrier protein] synthase